MGTSIYISSAIGASIGFIAWHPMFSGMPWVTLALLVFLPAAWVLAGSRLAAFALFLAYYAAFARDVHAAFTRFFPDEWTGWGYGLWLLHAAFLALPWAIFWKKEWSARAIAVRLSIVFAILLLPPVALFNWGHPLLAAGALFPGTGIAGLAGCAIFGYSIALWAIGDARGRNGAADLALASFLVNMLYVPPTPPAGWQAINTTMGRYPIENFNRRFTWQQELIRKVDSAITSGARVIVLPEEIAGEWKPSHSFWWKSTEKKAKKNGSTVLIGADLRSGKVFSDAVLALGKDSGVVLTARVPMPIGNWQFWNPGKSTATNIFDSGVRKVDGKKTAFSICYEDFLIWTHFEWMIDKPDVLVSMVNDWSVSGLAAQWHQTLSIESQARLGRVPLVRASND